jgi:hypothetical protein
LEVKGKRKADWRCGPRSAKGHWPLNSSHKAAPKFRIGKRGTMKQERRKKKEEGRGQEERLDRLSGTLIGK